MSDEDLGQHYADVQFTPRDYTEEDISMIEDLLDRYEPGPHEYEG